MRPCESNHGVLSPIRIKTLTMLERNDCPGSKDGMQLVGGGGGTRFAKLTYSNSRDSKLANGVAKHGSGIQGQRMKWGAEGWGGGGGLQRSPRGVTRILAGAPIFFAGTLRDFYWCFMLLFVCMSTAISRGMLSPTDVRALKDRSSRPCSVELTRVRAARS